MRKLVLGIAGLAVLLLAAGLLLSQPSSSGEDRVKVGYVPIAVAAPFFVAFEKGFFAEEGLAVEPVKFEAGTQLFDALLTYKIDAVALTGLAAGFEAEARTPGEVKAFWFNVNFLETGQYADAVIVAKNSSISSLAELRGKKIASAPHPTTLASTRVMLRKSGLDPYRDVEIVTLAAQFQLQALEKGDVAAVNALEPTATLGVKQGVARVLIEGPSERFIVNPYPGGAGFIKSSFLRQRPDTAAKLRRAIEKAIAWSVKNDAEARKLTAKYVPIPAEILLEFKNSGWWTAEEARREDNTLAIQKFADVLFEEKVLTKRVDVRPLVASA